MKLYRIFIAIHLPDETKDALMNLQRELPELPLKWTTREHAHLTLLFLGMMSAAELAELQKQMRAVKERHHSFELRISKLQYGPAANLPRMLWVALAPSKDLIALQKDIERTVKEFRPLLETSKNQKFIPHLTLGRIEQRKFEELGLEELPEIAADLNIAFQCSSFDVMSSKLHRAGAKYELIERYELKKRSDLQF